MNNQGLRKRLLGEVDVFQFDHTHELYAHMNINYVRLGGLPAFERWGEVLAPVANGEFFTTTGEVLLPDVNLASSSATEIVARARVLWTFPLKFAEIVWGDGRQHASAGDRAGRHARLRRAKPSSGARPRAAGRGRASRSGTSPATARS